jgi:hypothetical protein
VARVALAKLRRPGATAPRSAASASQISAKTARGTHVAHSVAESTVAPDGAVEKLMKAQIKKHRERLEGKVLVPALMWMAGVPFGVVLLLWFFFFRGN